MDQWNLVCLMGNSVGSVTIVANRETRHQSIGVAVKYHTAINTFLSNRQHQDKIGSKRKLKKVSFSLCKVLLAFLKVLWLETLSLVKVPIVSHHKERDKLTGRKFMKLRREKN